MSQPVLKEMRLVGGTALALQYGHRRSIDLDFFGTINCDEEELTDTMGKCADSVVRGHSTQNIKCFFLDNIKVDVVKYHYPWIDGPITHEGIRLASPKDIAAMKVNAAIGRGTKKDFIDIFFLLKHFSFDDIMKFYMEKYDDGSEYRALLSLSHFADAESQPMPYMLVPTEWDDVKDEIKKQIEIYNRKHL